MKLNRSDRHLIAWMLYCCVLFNVFACSIGHGQMVGMQLNGIGGEFCSTDGRALTVEAFKPGDQKLPTLSAAFGCPLCSTGGMGPALSSSLTLAILPETHSPPPAVVTATQIPSAVHWPTANPRAPPFA
ncbi:MULTISPECIES: DUF2946 domain-containing protein [unclassified Pseudomonas]|uniref:DUF2946 domain-containing protein n=1 Tax=unclassified Pseudomonas TaxID=196821 RepID=UPI00384ADEDF